MSSPAISFHHPLYVGFKVHPQPRHIEELVREFYCPTTMAYYTIYGFASQLFQLPLRTLSTSAERGACTAGKMEDPMSEPVRCAL